MVILYSLLLSYQNVVFAAKVDVRTVLMTIQEKSILTCLQNFNLHGVLKNQRMIQKTIKEVLLATLKQLHLALEYSLLHQANGSLT